MRYIVVGVVARRLTDLVSAAAAFAQRFDAELVCANVDATSYEIAREPDGSVVAMPLDPDLGNDGVECFDEDLHALIAQTLDGRGVAWSVRALAGGPAQELARLADELDAEMIVVGTRERGFRGSLGEFFTGSVAVQLAHRQHRPVVVIPLDLVGTNGPLGWREDRA